MAPTHALAGLALASVVALVSPGETLPLLIAGGIGGVLPDLDLYAGHRKTLHYPVYYPLAALVAAGIAVANPGTLTVALTVFLLAAGLHSAMDALGGGLELRPWEGTSDRAVYDHFNGRWLPPRRWVRYDGAPEDLALAGAFALPTLLLTPLPGLDRAIGALVVVGFVWVLARRTVPTLVERLVPLLPTALVGYLPARFTGG